MCTNFFCIIHKHPFPQIEFTCSLMFNEFLLNMFATHMACSTFLPKLELQMLNHYA
jgi:hypothetical protein